MTKVLPIVEGDGDLHAVPVLLRRVLHERLGRFDVQVLPAQKRGELPKVRQEFRRFYLTALKEDASILWVLDFDCDDCLDHAHEREQLLLQARSINPVGRLDIVFMVKEFESLFLHDMGALRSAFPELPGDFSLPRQPESIRGAKEWISKCLPKGRAYKPTVDQAGLCAKLDLVRLKDVSASFARFEAAVAALLN
ncbi:MAG TPA: DUF4276 family protein [Burkholderiaceae bacterium]